MDTQQLFAHFPEEIQIKLRSVMQIQTFAAGDPIFHQGESASAIYAVVSGRVKIARVTPDGNESILCVRQAGEYFCPVPVLDGNSHLGTAIAMTDVTIFWVERKTFQAICKESQQLLAAVQGDCLGEVRYLLNRLETFAFRNIKERLAIAMLNEVRHQRTDQKGMIELSMTQQELAGLVGASRESVSRNLKQLELDEVVELHRGKIHILDKEKLRKISNIE